MADWTQLPGELLYLISKRLHNSFDVNRFRSICSTWRSTVTSPKRHRLAPSFPVLPDEGGMANTSYGFSLSKRIVFCCDRPNPIPKQTGRPPGIVELGEEYVLHYLNRLSYLGDAGNLYMEKVVISCLENNPYNGYVLLTIHVSGKLAMFKSSDKKWTIIQDMSSPYDDVILYEGNFYAVDNNGRTVLVGLGFETSEAAMPVFGGDKKFLVESKGELLLVDKYLSIEAPEGSCSWAGLDFVDEYFENIAFYMNERTVRFNVFKLDEVGKQWVDVKNLDDRVLFLGDDCSFSASVEDLNVCRGNCIIFADNFFYLLEMTNLRSGVMLVYLI
ncbi:hypothetical protein F3Y22_tig00110332pilonHSYRG01196 [Hibiscus syriacus]|uniref:KIB1-4 beta-propeller domain-containing protein n=1 Tax=Hibiscus syriacus TaxID=106335 RepID=A0A6A3AXS5_HIBSY|nr:hypothetical protein F3Y22_tig00110332pilonHSYRG01196 [Hibiscus syriacus]